MNGDELCTCGHVFDEHGNDENYPGSSACSVVGCDCFCFEEDEETEEDPDEAGYARRERS